MTAAAAAARRPHFRPEGDLYSQFPDIVWTLEDTYLWSAALVCRIIINADKRGELDGDRGELLTNREIRRRIELETGKPISLSSVKKGLYALHRVLGEKGLAIIGRVRQHGRRLISLVRGLRESRSAERRAPGDPIIPPAPPPGEIQIQETAATGEGSPSPFATLAGGEGGLPDDLVGAVGLVPDLSRERLLGWTARFGAELARRGVAWLGVWLNHPRSEKRPQAASWAERALCDWKAKLDLGHLTVEDIDRQIEVKRGKWAPRPPAPRVDDSAEKAAAAAAEARDRRVREAWGLLSGPERDAIRATVLAANPHLRRLRPGIVEAECLAELERRQPRGP